MSDRIGQTFTPRVIIWDAVCTVKKVYPRDVLGLAGLAAWGSGNLLRRPWPAATNSRRDVTRLAATKVAYTKRTMLTAEEEGSPELPEMGRVCGALEAY